MTTAGPADDERSATIGPEPEAAPDAVAEPGADAAGERSQAERDFLIRQSMVGELEEFLTPEFLDRVRDRFEARLAERRQSEAAEPDA